MPDQRSNEDPLPDSLVVAIDERHLAAVAEWWNDLTDDQRHELLDDATNRPESIANQTDLDQAFDDDVSNEWYEYVVNHEMRFYFDMHNGCQTSHGYMVSPMLSAISASADAKIVSHILSRKSE